MPVTGLAAGFWRGVEGLGRWTTAPIIPLLVELHFLAGVVIGVGLASRGQWPFLIRHIWQQIYFTVVQRASLFAVVGLIIGALTALPLIVFGIRDPQVLGRIMHIMMYHQLNPILAALFVAGLSGAAITAEIGELRANQAMDHLTAMGLNPYSFFAFPRLIGMALALLILNCWLSLGVTVGAAIMLNAYQNIPPSIFLRVCVLGLTPAALALTCGMIIIQGAHIALVQTWRAFRVQAYVDIPRALPRAFAQSFIGCLLISLLFSLVRYG